MDAQTTKILIVDDEEIVLSLAHDALEDSGYDIELAKSADEAIQKLEKGFFDFILTDIRMPDCDGIQLARMARELIPSIGVMFMTGYANLNSAKDAIKEGAYDYIMKPFELNEIRQAVKNAIGKKKNETEKTLNNELSRLSELNELMYTMGDRKSLVRLSLGFAMMQARAGRGAIVYKTGTRHDVEVVSTANLGSNDFIETVIPLGRDYFTELTPDLDAPAIIGSLEEHPLYKLYGDRAMASFLIPPWFGSSDQLVNIALKRGSRLFGMLILGYPEDSDTLKGSDLKFLCITANQIAISLENITLLEESRLAYGRLKDLQDQTIQLEKMAAKGEMSAEIGHELNNFLGVVSGNLSLLEHHLKKKNYDDLEKYLGAIMANLEQMKKFTSNLMDYSGMESEYTECRVNDLIENILQYLLAQKRMQNVKVTFDRSAQDIATVADQSQFQQLLYNLINNAADATRDNHDGGGVVNIKTVLSDDTGHFTLTVEDNGSGFSPEHLEQAFNARFTTKENGHGFGLLVCKRIIDNHHGRLHVESQPGRGTIITITVPVKAASRQPVAVF